MDPRACLFARRVALSLLFGLAFPTSADAQDEPRGAGTRFVARQQLGLLLNPMGAEHRLELAGRASIGDQSSLLFQGAHLEVGVANAVSPVYAVGAGYVELSPLSVLVLRAEVGGEGIWPIGLKGAGYYGLCEYDHYLNPNDLSPQAARSAAGWRAAFSGTLQGMVSLGGVRLLFLDQFEGERAHVGDSPYYYDQRNDIVRAQTDWLLKNDVFLGLERDVEADTMLRLGVYDSLRVRPASSDVNHQLGPMVMVVFRRPNRTLSSITPFVRGGYYTHHGSRQHSTTILGGISLEYDL